MIINHFNTLMNEFCACFGARKLKTRLTIFHELAPVHLFVCSPVCLFTWSPVHLSTCSSVHLFLCPPIRLFTCSRVCHSGVEVCNEVCNEYWAGFQSSWCWGPTESPTRAGTRTTTASCCPSWTTRSPATSSTGWTPRTLRATSGSSYHGPPTSLR